MTAFKIAHFALWTLDLSKSAFFWKTYFHAEIGEIYESKRRSGFDSCFITLPGCATKIEIMIGPWLSPDMVLERCGWDHIAISLGDSKAVDDLAKRSADDGRLVSGPRTTGDGFYEAVIIGPDAAKIEITV